MGPARWAGLMWAGLNMCIACELAGRHRTAARPASTPGSAQAGVEPATVVIFSSGWHCHCAELIITKCILLCEAAAAACGSAPRPLLVTSTRSQCQAALPCAGACARVRVWCACYCGIFVFWCGVTEALAHRFSWLLRGVHAHGNGARPHVERRAPRLCHACCQTSRPG